ncbi:MAG TPA: helix-hairpin-helix domain-containing protein [Candidatus Binatia bacterium]|nr:helix-hairpin-helix domain-containing protein [Candidatus Binatia bacterium]
MTLLRPVVLLGVLLALTGLSPEARSSVDVNSADAPSLDALPGVGAQEAQAIVAWRDKNGPFTSIDEIEKVPGVSRRSIQNVRGDLSLGGQSEFAKMQESGEPARVPVLLGHP